MYGICNRFSGHSVYLCLSLAFVGPVELGSAGVSITIFNNISKLFNIPLLSVATSFVAEDISRNEIKDSPSGKFKPPLFDSGGSVRCIFISNMNVCNCFSYGWKIISKWHMHSRI